MPRPDNKNQYRYGPYDYRTANEDARRNKRDRDKKHWDNLNKMHTSNRTSNTGYGGRDTNSTAGSCMVSLLFLITATISGAYGLTKLVDLII